LAFPRAFGRTRRDCRERRPAERIVVRGCSPTGGGWDQNLVMLIMLVGGGLEEPGWRGFAQSRLLAILFHAGVNAINSWVPSFSITMAGRQLSGFVAMEFTWLTVAAGIVTPDGP